MHSIERENRLIILFCISIGNELHPTCEQMFGKASELKKNIKGKIYAVVSDSLTDDIVRNFDIDQIVECTAFKENDIYAGRIMVEILDKYKPLLVMVPDYAGFRAAAAYAASALNVGIVADCIDITIGYNRHPFYFKRSAYSEDAIVDIVGKNTTMIICVIKLNCFKTSIKPGMYKTNVKKSFFDGTDYYNENVKLLDSKVRNDLLEKWLDSDKKKIIIGIGRGIEKRYIEMLEHIAECIGAKVGYSRAVVESGMGSHELQIGQSGHFISADLYIAFGISGSLHHVCALNNCKKIIAINNDPSAAIFDFCDWGMCINAEKVINGLAAKLF